ncbi:MAG: hypothetical protein ACN2B6_00785 [Rickettsiales bacterium]
MLDNLEGSSLSESEVVERLQSKRNTEEQASAPIESTDEAEAETVEEETVEAGDFDQEEVETSEEEAVETYRIKASGEELDVTFDQLVENFEKGQDYYKKTSKLADERKAWEAEKAQLAQSVEAEKQNYVSMVQQLNELVKTQEQDINWDELRETDPSEYLRQKELIESRKQAVSDAQAKMQAEVSQKRQEMLNSESQKLLTVMGEQWKDPEVRQKDIESMYEYAYANGVTKEEASNILDHRFWAILHKAMKYEKLQETSEVVKKQVKSAPKTVKSKKPVQRVRQEEQDARKRLKASGGKSQDDVVALLKAKRNR